MVSFGKNEIIGFKFHLLTKNVNFVDESKNKMTDPEKNLLLEFKLKVKQMIAKHENLKQEKEQLRGKIESLEETINQLRQENSLLEQKYENVKLAKMLVASDDDNKDARSKIQKLVREIDKCIALLNK
jgi:predicted nuclease with TOPRIM domain